jgi:hypothetical protein
MDSGREIFEVGEDLSCRKAALAKLEGKRPARLYEVV